MTIESDYGVCSGWIGNVYLANMAASQIVEVTPDRRREHMSIILSLNQSYSMCRGCAGNRLA